MSLKCNQYLAFDYLCTIPEDRDPALKSALRWMDEKAFKEGITTYEMLDRILRVAIADKRYSQSRKKLFEK